jgi:hypothetical protein
MSDEYIGGIIPMAISPDIVCYGCGENRWGMCIVNTNPQFDWGLKVKIPFYFGISDCLECGTTIRWKIDPDSAYPPCDPDTNDASPI